MLSRYLPPATLALAGIAVSAHAAFLNRDELLPGRFHPNTAGATLLAKTVYTALTGKPAGEVPNRALSLWNGYDRLDVVIDGRRTILVSPKTAAPRPPVDLAHRVV